MPNTVYTIGHSTHPIDRFIELLASHHVMLVADVRSHPHSRFAPQFNRKDLQAALQTAGISYIFMGRELGARPEDRACYDERGKVQYERLARTEQFQEGLRWVAEEAKRQRLVLMCAEEDPLKCHRTILICRHLLELDQDIVVQHIRGNGDLESHDEALSRLLVELKLPKEDLFRTHEEIIAEAYERQGRKIAYTDDSHSS